MADNSFNSTVESLFKGMDSFVSSKTVVGEPIRFGDTIILPLIDVSFGLGGGAFGDPKKKNSGGGLGGKITPNSVLIIQGEKIRLVNIRNQDGITKILDLVPEIVDRITAGKKAKNRTDAQQEKYEAAGEALSEMLDQAVSDKEEKK
jgi:uncharacterized spore protein YtfJ